MTPAAPFVLSVHPASNGYAAVRLGFELHHAHLVADLAELLASCGHPKLEQLGPCFADALRILVTIHGPDALRPCPVTIG
jgi:hypothetical protein